MPYKIKSEKVKGVEPKIFRTGGRRHHWIRIYVEATEGDSLEAVRSVQYELHPTFRERVRVAYDAVNQFEIRIWTYGYFNIQAFLMMQDGTTQNAKGFVKW